MALTSSDGPVRLFCGYHPEDRRFYKELSRHLAPFVDRGILQIQCSDGMLPGEVELQFLEKELANTEIIVLLVSPDLMGTKPSGDFWTNTLARLAPERLPLLLVEVRRMSLTDTCLEGRPLLPRRPRLPLVVHDDRESAWSKIAKKIRKAALDIRRPASGSVGNDRRPSGVMSLESVKSRRGLAYDLRYQGKSSEALQELLLALETLDTLSARDPASPLLKAERAHLHDRIGQCKYAQGNSPAALAAFDLAFEIRVQLAASLEDPAVLFDLSTSRFWRGYMSYVLGDLSRARDEQRAGMDLCRSLYTSDGNDLAARSLVVLETDLGTTLKELDDGLAAAKHLRNALAFARMLAGQKPE